MPGGCVSGGNALPFFLRSTCGYPDIMASEREKMLGGEFYDPHDAELASARSRARAICSEINRAAPTETESQRRLMRALFGSGGDTVWLQPPFFCDYGSNIYLGERVFRNFNCVVLDVCEVRIGDFSQLGPAVQILTPLHPFDARLRRKQEFGRPIAIGNDVWIGGGALILPGVRIGDGAVVGAGSVVTRDVPPGVLAAGNPCRVIRSLT